MRAVQTKLLLNLFRMLQRFTIKVGILIFLSVVCSFGWAQDVRQLGSAGRPEPQQTGGRGVIQGKLTDYETGEGLASATIRIEGTTIGTNTDLDGNFQITAVPVGTYNIVISYLGYKTDTLKSVAVKKDQATVLQHKLLAEGAKLGSVEIVAERTAVQSTEVSAISEMRNSLQVTSVISSQLIAKSLDKDAGEVVKRVPGITIANDRFVVVRGLPERYSVVLLNDIITPSSETDKRAFSFDLIPSNLMDRLSVSKTPTPELPGDVAGATISIYTRNATDNKQISFNTQVGYRPGSSFANNFPFQPQPGRLDWLGIDNGFKSLSNSFPGPGQLIPASAARGIPNTFGTRIGDSPLDWKLGFTYYGRFKLGGKIVRSLSSLSYSQAYERFDIERGNQLNQAYQSYLAGSPITTLDYFDRYNDNEGTHSVRTGLLQNFTFVLNDRNKVEFKNFVNLIGSSRATVRNGFNPPQNGLIPIEYRINYYRSRFIYTGSFHGQHLFSGDRSIEWNAGYSYAGRQEPDFNRLQIRGNVFIPSTPDNTIVGKYYSNTDENVMQASVKFEKKYESGWLLRAGSFNTFSFRSFNSRLLGITRDFAFNPVGPLATLSPEQIFAPENFRDDQTGFRYNESTRANDSYTATNQLTALYGAVNIPLFDKRLDIYTGVRIEYNRQTIDSRDLSGLNPVKVDNPIVSILPSLNANYKLSEKQNLRLTYGLSVNRPELRELAPFSFYDFDIRTNRFGNPNLRTAVIHNVDVRWELYPELNEMIQVGVFYKNFTNTIEEVILVSTEPNFSWKNANSAYAVGAEVEVRKGLDFVSERLRNLSILLNGSYIYSRVGEIDDTNIPNRPMQGQSPYVVNAGLFYNNEKIGLQINALYNVYGPRIWAVGFRTVTAGVSSVIQPNILENPRNVIDLSITKKLGKYLEIKAGAQDILNQPFYFYQDWDQSQTLNGSDSPYIKYRQGSYYTLGITFKY